MTNMTNMTNIASIDITIPQKLKPLLENKARYYITYGGRGGAKSYTIALILLLRSLQSKHRILCCREVMRSIKDSTWKLLCDIIEEKNLSSFFDITRDSIKCKITGSEFIFAGIAEQGVASIKSYTNISICFIEEAQNVSERSFQILIPTIRAEDSCFYIAFNPDKKTDPVYRRFVLDPPENSIVIKINATDNPWLPDTLLEEMRELKNRNYDLYRHVYDGECRSQSDAAIFLNKISVKSFIPHETWSRLQGIDFGYSVDPSAGVICFYDEANHDLYIYKEVYGVGIEIVDMPNWLDGLDPSLLARKYITRCDNSRPEIISHLARNNWKARACKKWVGSVLDRYEYLRSFNHIYIHPTCVNALDEFNEAVWKVDKITQDILPEIGSFADHLIDAVCYAIEPIILGHKQQIPDRPETPKLDSYGNPQGYRYMPSKNAWM